MSTHLDLKLLRRLRIIALQALVSNDSLMRDLVQKGGNALDLIYNISSRASFDLDFSIAKSFDDEELPKLENRMRILLERSFGENGYQCFDVKLAKRPSKMLKGLDDIWGGYKLEFKLMEKEHYEKVRIDHEQTRREAIFVGPKNINKMRIEISRYEHCPSEEHDLEGYMIKVYSPSLIAVEKLRAICQQMDEYKSVIPSLTPSPRARDFFDIYTIADACELDLTDKCHREMVYAVFEAKRVPLSLIGLIKEYKEFHEPDFESVRATVAPGIELKSFDFYFSFVARVGDDLCKKLKA